MTFSKIKISGIIEVKTGLHIGGDSSFSAIGAIDSPVVRDTLTGQPIIPGSSLKGKMRSLLAREKRSVLAAGVKGFENDPSEVKRLFGSSCKKSNAEGTGMQMSRLQFVDSFLLNKADLPQVFENKFENTIDRLSAEAKPRQIERVIRGAQFGLELIYNVEEPEHLEEDFSNIALVFNLLRHDYLGGGGTRGSGRVEISNISAEFVVGDATWAIPDLG